MTRMITLISIVTLVSACAGQQRQPELSRIPADTTVRLEVNEADARLPDASADGGTYAANVGAGALAGAGMGAVAGFGMGIVCGPAIVICGPLGAMGGAMGGAVLGIGAGTFAAASLQLPQEKAEALDDIIARTMTELDMADAVSADFRSATESRWSYVDDNASVDIRIVIEGIQLEKHKKDQLSMSTTTSLVVTARTGDRAIVERREYRMTSGTHHIDFWIEDDGSAFRRVLANQLSDHVGRITAQLQGPASLARDMDVQVVSIVGPDPAEVGSQTAHE